ncbi:uncharacterized protein LOC124268980 isoform X3 [Haliotis rubra]|uniref:uncharacterized protein LOC124268980 isoform X3 n=1 Tax=Haliotis rubra TaxID=36100 RepID=UPI001EE59AD8|nr:uncharacterized protein LOC124268980 isoform X3 [Haliotis rubra]
MRDAPNKPRRRSEADRQQMARFRRRHRSFDDHNMEAMRERWTTPATCSPPTTTTTLASAYSTRASLTTTRPTTTMLNFSTGTSQSKPLYT